MKFYSLIDESKMSDMTLNEKKLMINAEMYDIQGRWVWLSDAAEEDGWTDELVEAKDSLLDRIRNLNNLCHEVFNS